jgi:hypothetical protein
MADKVLFDRRRDIACVFFLFSIGGFWWNLGSDPVSPKEPLWLNVLFSSLLLIVGIGIWRATEWARWGGGLVGLIEAVQFGWMLVSVLAHGSTASSAHFALLAVVGFFALWWAAIAFYLLKPSTKRLFAHVRDARSAGQQAPA